MSEIQQNAERIPPRPHFHVGQAVTYRGETYLIDELAPVLPGPVWCAWLAGPDAYFVVPCFVLRAATKRQETLLLRAAAATTTP